MAMIGLVRAKPGSRKIRVCRETRPFCNTEPNEATTRLTPVFPPAGFPVLRLPVAG
jgi:hypothetical protein